MLHVVPSARERVQGHQPRDNRTDTVETMCGVALQRLAIAAYDASPKYDLLHMQLEYVSMSTYAEHLEPIRLQCRRILLGGCTCAQKKQQEDRIASTAHDQQTCNAKDLSRSMATAIRCGCSSRSTLLRRDLSDLRTNLSSLRQSHKILAVQHSLPRSQSHSWRFTSHANDD